MKLNKADYVLEHTSDGGYYVWLTVSVQCNAYDNSLEEVVIDLEQTMEDMIEETYLVEDLV